ncbi:hypothetical protein AWJ20_1953 [Sugiyamaella lignohabitans]|uniref:Uncharacterized protein n=1 Tax=Sugiyamaella lignohabitans TaxID=796027 RepID=A0A167E578_9ASCO|nr:uncharacterized protein AWJ20_1953 [Sugiyamaella lignohabitans]ANB13654.1 hypothetical protein AWJ20_1953 [Sugiyamaella lignohabitans]
MKKTSKSESSTSTTTLSTGRVRWDRSDVLNTTNLDSRTGKSSKSRLSTRTRGLGTGTTSSSDLEVEGVDTNLLALDGNVLSGQHGSVRRRLVVVGLDLHTTGNTRDGFTTGQIGNVDEGIIERCKDTSNSEDKLSLTGLETKGDVF